MSSELAPLDPDVRSLLDAVDHADASTDAAIVSRMRERMDLALAGAASEPPQPPANVAPSVTGPTSTLRRVLSFAGTFAAGAVVALAAERLVAPSAPPPTVPTIPAPALVSDAAAAPTAIPTATTFESSPPAPPATTERAASPSRPAPATSTSAPVRTLAPPAEESRDEDLAAESRLVDTARSALAHGDFAAALVAATSHERRFPSGRLVEEREAILIQALAGTHQGTEARIRADAFRARYPQSFFLPLVQRALVSAHPEPLSPSTFP